VWLNQAQTYRREFAGPDRRVLASDSFRRSRLALVSGHSLPNFLEIKENGRKLVPLKSEAVISNNKSRLNGPKVYLQSFSKQLEKNLLIH
jgi:hypothetical protein